jgi:hypothetical protein
VSSTGILREVAAALRGCGDAKAGVVLRYVQSGFTWLLVSYFATESGSCQLRVNTPALSLSVSCMHCRRR